jgi:hypothetical protein
LLPHTSVCLSVGVFLTHCPLSSHRHRHASPFPVMSRLVLCLPLSLCVVSCRVVWLSLLLILSCDSLLVSSLPPVSPHLSVCEFLCLTHSPLSSHRHPHASPSPVMSRLDLFLLLFLCVSCRAVVWLSPVLILSHAIVCKSPCSLTPLSACLSVCSSLTALSHPIAIAMHRHSLSCLVSSSLMR